MFALSLTRRRRHLEWCTDCGISTELWLITEFMANGSLFDVLCARTVDEEGLLKMAASITAGLSYLHTELTGGTHSTQLIH